MSLCKYKDIFGKPRHSEFEIKLKYFYSEIMNQLISKGVKCVLFAIFAPHLLY